MPRLVKVALGSFIFLLALSAVQAIQRDYAGKYFVSEFAPHLIIAAVATLVGAVLLWIVEDSISKHLAPHVRAGFDKLAAALAKEVQRFPESWKSLSDASALADLQSTIKTPELRELLSKGMKREALAKLDTLILDVHKKQEEEIALLVLSDDKNNWDKALEKLRGTEIQNPKNLVPLAYRFFSIGKIPQAIEVAEMGLHCATANKDDVLVAKLKNNLAYFFADAQLPECEMQARAYAAAARAARPGEPQPLDTEGYVKITYGKTRAEIDEGVELCHLARRIGTPLSFYIKHLTRADQRSQALPG